MAKHKTVRCKIETTNKFNNQIIMTCGKRFLNGRGKGATTTTKTRQMKEVNQHIMSCVDNEIF
ncbi:hypothetical protein MYMA111404_02945 [Mycoplasma marinum]|uniref:Uncharacterized protein n=1 Tax=Mycoplasma marinum TaxID=1937190 RepID=A0A4R0XLD9_9MOLU|nr:hypothetical protein [Mycoplasma marinum]TCG11284.1 hypothetical protein C4B24_02455 [Mycoplasma marinum]